MNFLTKLIFRNVPEHIKLLVGSNRGGPNCWNATIMWHDKTVFPEFTSEESMERWLKKNAFRVKESEAMAGDILVMRQGIHNTSQLTHTAVLVNGIKSPYLFHKVGCHGPEGWCIESLREVKNKYHYANISHWYRVGAVIERVA